MKISPKDIQTNIDFENKRGKIMPLDKTSDLAKNMTKEAHDNYFEKLWLSYVYTAFAGDDARLRTKSFNNLKEIKEFIKEEFGDLKEYEGGDMCIIFRGTPVNLIDLEA